MANACALPVAVAGALMPDAHVGYGLPIGGVLATENAVIPYAVGVDIACRMKLTVFDRKANTIAGQTRPAREHHRARDALRHGLRVQAAPRARRDGRRLDGLAASRSGCATRRGRSSAPAAAAIISSSSARSRSTQNRRERSASSRANISRCSRTQRLARHRARRCASTTASSRWTGTRELPKELKHLAWLVARRAGRPGILGRDEPDGPLRRGEPRAHPQAHRAASSARTCILDIENHHNFAWKETPRRERRGTRSRSCTARARRPRAPACSASSPARWRRPASSCAARATPESLDTARRTAPAA